MLTPHPARRKPHTAPRSLAALLILCAAASPAFAGGSLVGEEMAAEALMEFSGSHMEMLIHAFGNAAPGESLAFSSFVAVDEESNNYSFAYQSLPGQTYRGMPVTLSAVATFDAPTNQWTSQRTGSAGGTPFDFQGIGEFFGTRPPSFGMSDSWMPDPFPLETTVIANITYEQTAIRTVSHGTLRTVNWLGDVISERPVNDNRILQGPNAGGWSWDLTATSQKVGASTSGSTPIGGGFGSFIVTFTVPAPGAGAAGLMMMMAMGRVPRRRR